MAPSVLILSSHVAASRVGAGPVAHALAMRGFEPIIAPTTLLGRHPGWGAPGGGGVPAELFEGMLGGVEAHGDFGNLSAVLTGYFASAAQIEVAAHALRRVRAANPRALLVVDPVLGDHARGLYVKPEVAAALPALLLPLADLITPNLWELERLLGRPPGESAPEIAAAALTLAPAALVSSIGEADYIGALYADRAEAWLALGPRYAQAPNGVGDLLAGVFLSAWIERLPARQALARAVGVVAAVVGRAARDGLGELPIIAAQDAFAAPSGPVSLRAVERAR